MRKPTFVRVLIAVLSLSVLFGCGQKPKSEDAPPPRRDFSAHRPPAPKAPPLAATKARIQEAPKSAYAWMDHGGANYREGRLADAEEAFKRFLDLSSPTDPNRSNALYYLAYSQVAQNRLEPSVDSFTKLAQVEKTPENRSIAYLELANVQLELGRQKESEAAFAHSLEEDPKQARAAWGMGTARAHSKRYSEAIKFFELAMDNAPNLKFRASCIAAIGTAELEMGNRGQAVKRFKEALAINPQNSIARQGLESMGLKAE